MKTKIDVSDWWTQERIEAEEAVWLRDGFFTGYANQVRDFMRKHNLKTVLEVGCGSGHVARELNNEFEYTGIDGSGLMVEFAKKTNPGHRFELANIRSMNIATVHAGENMPFDLVCSFAVLKHFLLKDWAMALRNMLSVGNNGLIQVQMRPDGYPSVEDGSDCPHNWVTEKEMREAVAKAGHKVVAINDTGKDVSPYMANAYEAMLITKKI